MSEVAERDFRTFELGDNVYELADGVVPEVADLLDFKLSQEPNSAELFELVGVLGKKRVLRENEPVEAIDRATTVQLVNRSGIQRSLDRSLWTPGISISSDDADAHVATGAMANWQDRAAALMYWGSGKTIYLPAGMRPMNTVTEKANYHVQRYQAEHGGDYPTEYRYVRRFIQPRLEEAEHNVKPVYVGSKKGEVIAAGLFKRFPELLDQRLVFARVANAGIQLAVQMRTAAREIDPNFDNNPANPQVFILTDEFSLATTDDQEANPVRFQKASNALRQMLLTAKMLHEAAGGE